MGVSEYLFIKTAYRNHRRVDELVGDNDPMVKAIKKKQERRERESK